MRNLFVLFINMIVMCVLSVSVMAAKVDPQLSSQLVAKEAEFVPMLKTEDRIRF